jgi:ubiquinone/menaquinone biosynthesis C-methylase UbiE
MSSVIDYYNGFGEKEWSRLDREPLEFLVNLHYINQYLPENGCILDNGAGPGKYSMPLAEKGLRLTLTDLTPKLVGIAKEKARELGVTENFDGFHVADARNLSIFQDEMFDATLMLGPLYHLQTEQGRLEAIQELQRVTKKNGVVFVAFRSRINHLIYSLLYPTNWKPNDNVDTINEFMRDGIFNHIDKGRYTGAYFFNIEEINPFMESNGFESLDLIGSTNIGAILNEEQWRYWREKDDEYSKLLNLLIKTAKEPTILGMSSHLLYIGRRK